VGQFLPEDMAPSKRPQRSTATSRQTKIARLDPVAEDPLAEKLDTIARQLKQASNIPENARDMLIAMLPDSLGVPKDQRHAYQQSFVEVLTKTYLEIKAEIQKRIDDAAALVEGSSAERASLEARQAAAEADLNDKREFRAAKNAELAKATTAFKGAKARLGDAEVDRASGDAELEPFFEKKDVFEKGLSNLYTPLRESAWNKQEVSELVSFGKIFSFDSSMLLALPCPLGKELNERSPFDSLVIKGLDDAIGKARAVLDEPLQRGATAKANLVAAVQIAEAELETAKSQQIESAAIAKGAQGAEQESHGVLREAKRAVEHCAPHIENVRRGCEQDREELSLFCMAFTDLAEHKTPSTEADEGVTEANMSPDAPPVSEPEESAASAEVNDEEPQIDLLRKAINI